MIGVGLAPDEDVSMAALVAADVKAWKMFGDVSCLCSFENSVRTYASCVRLC